MLMSQPTHTNPTPHLSALLAAEPDLVDRIFDYLLDVVPALAGDVEKLAEAKAAVRDEFGGDRAYVKLGRSQKSKELAQEILRLFNGRNTTEVARRLGIGRTTVYRVIKQSGRSMA